MGPPQSSHLFISVLLLVMVVKEVMLEVIKEVMLVKFQMTKMRKFVFATS